MIFFVLNFPVGLVTSFALQCVLFYTMWPLVAKGLAHFNQVIIVKSNPSVPSITYTKPIFGVLRTLFCFLGGETKKKPDTKTGPVTVFQWVDLKGYKKRFLNNCREMATQVFEYRAATKNALFRIVIINGMLRLISFYNLWNTAYCIQLYINGLKNKFKMWQMGIATIVLKTNNKFDW